MAAPARRPAPQTAPPGPRPSAAVQAFVRRLAWLAAAEDSAPRSPNPEPRA